MNSDYLNNLILSSKANNLFRLKPVVSIRILSLIKSLIRRKAVEIFIDKALATSAALVIGLLYK